MAKIACEHGQHWLKPCAGCADDALRVQRVFERLVPPTVDRGRRANLTDAWWGAGTFTQVEDEED